ncbi:Cytochrome P450 monooxygenase TRI4 [Fulvia fulva]|uniref:Cytochrome P450 monooxygenase TRI4 n=1 Tax=Passalora fulva TaxID=5499 RepID=A0A9Q8P4Y8_PASFU|nr:Cytochrome P450 monooxygenase TRI4 [Fulvia fulva]KAK4632289.1 Cytochrome P450 monooxygenase TRI4 [Fulvia fulva]KAK4632897.1 Cytochrome P450 monooxygenase TRI4 [Fulvia fulva]UJO13590.1 Cytochrome P450 monooxygenase TRI4 [Fulvia fulva]WPV10692.1 Cytochrome P450 monooxygenase TRI4 [Fulvia fulva]WPV26638.1 Cytochrome P450 monooxygenase TRI4 [Fulvia fulva]
MDVHPTHLAVMVAGGLLAALVYTVTHRLFFHPLAKVPGPVLVGISTLYEMYYELWLPGQYHSRIRDLHAKYGPIIRPVPEEVHINDPEFLGTIYALRNRNNPNKFGLMVDQSVAGAEDFYLHKMRRDALNPYFSQKSVLSMEYLIVEKREQVTRHVESALKSGQPLNLSDVYFAFANDLVRNFCFGSNNGLMNRLPEAKVESNNLMRFLTGVKINKHFPWIGRGLSKLGGFAVPPAVMDLIEFKAAAGKDIEAVLADTHNDRKGRHSVFYELRDSETLPPEEKTLPRLQDEATILVMAGTESTAKSLGYGSFYLLHYPTTLQNLRDELHEARSRSDHDTLSLTELLQLPYLNAVILETNRLTFGVTNRMTRSSPTESLTYTASYGPNKGQTYVFPPGTEMSCITYGTHMNEELFPDPPHSTRSDGLEMVKM